MLSAGKKPRSGRHLATVLLAASVALAAGTACVGEPEYASPPPPPPASTGEPASLLPDAACAPGQDRIIGPPVVVERTVEQAQALEAQITAEVNAPYSYDAWRKRLDQTMDPATMITARVNGLFNPRQTAKGSFALDAKVVAANRSLPVGITILQHKRAGEFNSAWHLRAEAAGADTIVFLAPTDEKSVYRLVVDLEREIHGFAYRSAGGLFRIPGGPEAVKEDVFGLSQSNVDGR